LTQVGAIAGMVLIGSQADSSAGKTAAILLPGLGAQLLTQKYSRDAEREADEYGIQYMSEAGYDPAGAVELQETFVRLSEGRNPDWLSGLFASHPPSRERVERNRATAAGLPSGGDLGAERYRQKTAYLRKIEPAYAAYDKALKAAGSADLDLARKELDRALAIEPREALFHALDGDLERKSGNPQAALSAFEQAVKHNPGYFYGRMRRGEMYLAAGRLAEARTDLQMSLELLPTAVGHYPLGNLERDTGDKAAAKAHYRQAAASNSEVGKAAQRELAKLEQDEPLSGSQGSGSRPD
jgi:predicted Zn-dependent protease